MQVRIDFLLEVQSKQPEFKFSQTVCLYLRHTFLTKSSISILPDKQDLGQRIRNCSKFLVSIVLV
jgi:hypothetical protein